MAVYTLTVLDVLSSLSQPAWHGEKYVTSLEPHTGSNIADVQSQLALQEEFSCRMCVLYHGVISQCNFN